jgi:hypothetical protein
LKDGWSRLCRRNPSQRQSELLLEGELMEERRLVVRGQCDDQRPLRPQSHIDAWHLLQFRAESGPARLTLAPERDQRLFAGLGLRAGGQHARGAVARTGTGCTLIEHRNRCVPRYSPQPARGSCLVRRGQNGSDTRWLPCLNASEQN